MSTDKNTPSDTEVIVVNEENDGSAIVELPPSIQAPDHEGSDEDDAAEQRAEIAKTGAIDPDQEALREARRSKRKQRKEYHKSVATEKDLKLQTLERQNRELMDRLSAVEKDNLGQKINQIDGRINEEQNRIAFAKQKIKEATETGNGDLLLSAQEMLEEAKNNQQALRNMKKRATAPVRQPTIQAPDPNLQRHAANWMANNPWYDPNGKDPDSKRALNEDQILADEGYDPATAEYWDELTRRLSKIVPHRYTDTTFNEPRSNSKPRNVVTGSGRESSPGFNPRNQFMLSREQVSAMKDAGMWDDPEKRARMIKRYAQEARNIGNRS